MEEKGIDRNEARDMLRLSKAAEEVERAKWKFKLMLCRWMERHEYFHRVINDPKERRKFQRSLRKIANS